MEDHSQAAVLMPRRDDGLGQTMVSDEVDVCLKLPWQWSYQPLHVSHDHPTLSEATYIPIARCFPNQKLKT